jgi:hypothetical protein
MKAFRFQRKNGTSTIFGRTIGLVGVGVVVLLLWLAADPEAHEHFHHDAGQEDHHCVITDFAIGEGFYLAPSIAVRPVAAVFGSVSFEVPGALREPVDYALPPSCGPPSHGLIG